MTRTFSTALPLIAAFVMTTGTVSAQNIGGRQLSADLTGTSLGTATFYVNVGQSTICHELNIPGGEPSVSVNIYKDGYYIYEGHFYTDCLSGLDQAALRDMLLHPEEYFVSVEGAISIWTGYLKK